MIRIDEARIHDVIRQRGPASVALNGPDGMLPQVQAAASGVTREFGIPAYVLADTTWGSCDTNQAGAEALGAGVLFNIGHTIGMRELGGGYVVMVDAFDDIGFGRVAAECAKMLSGRTVSLLTDSQHLPQVGAVRDALDAGGVRVVVGAGGGQLNDAQVFGCEFYPAAKAAADGAEANVFMGQSSFHAAGVALSTGLPTYALDPYFGEVRDVTGLAQKMQRRAVAAIYAAADARTFGLIVGLKEGQLSRVTALRLRRELEAEGREVQLLAMSSITADRLESLTGIDAFVQVACPRISTDNPFRRPVLSVPQADALLRVMRGGEPGEFLRAPHWL